ncbi:hypothetical protein J3D55_002338 [Chryseobacterium ginsenosidimutans]|uniref:RHS repeat domain-containing protein n=1 Tax=Chryseobacterium ginsenosidimutans TaxID=687846 RepID=UPI002169B5E9|nr:RHS repeat domain-containing protein [Chryseobacterium ginsenosidimutans]MCS3869422.1 hypothetical protein [Chryseobacterium ginsenosidimutans]
MKKNYKAFTKYMMAIFLLLISSAILKAQGFEVQKDSYNKIPNGNMANGLPQIGFPLLSVPTSSPKLSFNFGVDYNANRTSNQNLPGDVGKGWSLSSDYAVIRVSHGLPADYNITHTAGFYADNINNGNVFQYSIPGESARFMINYDKATHQYVGISDHGFKSKILIEKNTTDTLVYKIKSFTVIDAKGLKYVFDKPDISYYRGIGDNHIFQKKWVDLYHGAFHITKILDNQDNILATFEYLTSTGTVSDSRGSYGISQSKISKIVIPNVGSISFTYSGWDIVFPQMVPLPKIIVKDVSGNIINQVLFEYNGNYLNSFATLDKNNAVIEKYTFEYNIGGSNSFDQFGFPNNLSYCSIDGNERFFSPIAPNPKYSTVDLLKTVYLPTGGRTEYEYESNTVSSPAPYYTYPGYFDSYNMDVVYDADFSKQLAGPPVVINVDPVKYQKYFVTVTDGITYFKSTDRIDHYGVDYYITKANDGSSLDDLFTYHDMDTDTNETCDDLKTFTPPNDSPVNINIAGKSSGHIKIYAIKSDLAPFYYTEGVRIKNIKKYENDNSSVPTENLNYQYNYFDNPQASSAEDYGIISYPLPSGLDKVLRQMVYKNVKVTDAVRNFYTKYTFLLPSEAIGGNTLLDYGAPYSTGLPLKIEQYTAGNQLVSEKNIQYTFSSKTIDDKYLVPSYFNYPLLQKQTVTEKVYRENNTILTTSSEKIYEPLFSNLISEKSTDFSGETIEATYKYASEVQNQNLLSANKVGTPVIIETKSTRSGTTTPLSKTENLYTIANSSEPSGVLSYDPVSGTPTTETTIDKYDAYGNLIQATGKDGMIHCIIYGYHGTLPIAKISGITYDALQNQGLLSAMISASDADADNSANENQLINALNVFRRSDALKNLPVATFTYDPLVGITSETDPAGIKKVYQYDNANRLIKILDASGNTLQEFKTHFKGQ